MQAIEQAGPSLLARRLSLLVRASGFLLGVLATALAATLLFVSIRFSDKQIASDVADFVRTEYGRTLSTPEGIHLVLLPWPRLQIGAATLSEPDRPESFASWKQATFELEALPLLSRELVVRHARIDGLTLRLVRDRKGVWNTADLMAPADPAVVAPFSMQLEGLALSHAGVVFDDAISGRKLQWRELEFGSDAWLANRGGRVRLIAQLASAETAMEGKLSVMARYRFGESLATGSLTGVQAHYVGDIGVLKTTDANFTVGSADWQAEGWKFADVQLNGASHVDALLVQWTAALADAGWKEGLHARSATATLKLRGAEGGGPSGELQLALHDLTPDAKAGSRARLEGGWLYRGKDGSTQGKLRGLLRYDRKDDRKADANADALALEGATGEVSLSHPALRGGNLLASFKGKAGWLLSSPRDGPRATLDINVGLGKDVVHLAGSLAQGSGQDGKPLLIGAQLESKHLDLDHVLVGDVKPLPRLPTASDLQGWALDAAVRIDDLSVQGMHLSSVRLPLKVADGKLALPAHELQLYGGKLNGNLAWDPAKQAFSVYEALREVQLDALAQDVKQLLPLGGLVNATLDARAQGTSWQTLPDGASGALRLYAKNSRWQGVDLPRSMLALHAGKPALNDARSATPLSELSAAFNVKGPQLVVDKLAARSDALSLAGTGNIRYVTGELDLALSTRPGNDKALAELKGQRVAVRAKGRLLQPQLQAEAGKP